MYISGLLIMHVVSIQMSSLNWLAELIGLKLVAAAPSKLHLQPVRKAKRKLIPVMGLPKVLESMLEAALENIYLKTWIISS